MDIQLLALTGLALAAMLAVTLAVRKLWRVPEWADPLIALARAVVQLAALSLVLSAALEHIGFVVAALCCMVIFAVWGATRRIERTWRMACTVAGAMVLGIATALALVFGLGALDLSGQYLLALGGILTGNAMSIVTLAGRRFVADVSDHWGEVEGWLALGATPKQSVRTLASWALSEALIPSVDQTRVTGIVTIPGGIRWCRFRRCLTTRSGALSAPGPCRNHARWDHLRCHRGAQDESPLARHARHGDSGLSRCRVRYRGR